MAPFNILLVLSSFIRTNKQSTPASQSFLFLLGTFLILLSFLDPFTYYKQRLIINKCYLGLNCIFIQDGLNQVSVLRSNSKHFIHWKSNNQFLAPFNILLVLSSFIRTNKRSTPASQSFLFLLGTFLILLSFLDPFTYYKQRLIINKCYLGLNCIFIQDGLNQVSVLRSNSKHFIHWKSNN